MSMQDSNYITIPQKATIIYINFSLKSKDSTKFMITNTQTPTKHSIY